jgi:Domain of unknown function (DUF4136)
MNPIMASGVILISAQVGFAYQVQVNFDPASHFSCYKTYRLVHSTDAQLSRALFPTGIRERLAGLVEERLAAEGLKPVATGGDLMISYRIHVTEHPQNINLSDGVGPTGLGWGDTTYIATVGTVHEWTLTIDIVDTKQNHLVFEGKLSQTVSSRPQKNAKKLAAGVDEILEKYPPRP